MERVNPRTLTPPAPLPAYMEGYVQGQFGWEGTCVEVAVRHDSGEGMRWCHDHGFIDHNTQTLSEKTLLQWCEENNASKCAALLKKLGYPGRQPRNP